MEQNYPVIDTGQNYPAQDTKPKHSGFGIASFIISILAPAFLICSWLFWYVIVGGERPTNLVFMVVFFGAFSLLFIGVGLGIAGLSHENRRKIFAILGLAISSVSVLGLALILLEAGAPG